MTSTSVARCCTSNLRTIQKVSPFHLYPLSFSKLFLHPWDVRSSPLWRVGPRLTLCVVRNLRKPTFRPSVERFFTDGYWPSTPRQSWFGWLCFFGAKWIVGCSNTKFSGRSHTTESLNMEHHEHPNPQVKDVCKLRRTGNS